MLWSIAECCHWAFKPLLFFLCFKPSLLSAVKDLEKVIYSLFYTNVNKRLNSWTECKESCITVWYGGSIISGHKTLQRPVRADEKTIPNVQHPLHPQSHQDCRWPHPPISPPLSREYDCWVSGPEPSDSKFLKDGERPPPANIHYFICYLSYCSYLTTCFLNYWMCRLV